jgi:aryl-alcohol dehydrogenase-like predicted oxidoreductase
MHHVDRATPWEEIWQAMEQLVRDGKISYVGSSNFAGWDVALAQCAASARHFMDLTSEQGLYNLVVRAVEMEMIPALRSLGIGLIPYSPLHAGLLAGVLGTATEEALKLVRSEFADVAVDRSARAEGLLPPQWLPQAERQPKAPGELS